MSGIKYYSTNRKAEPVSFGKALLKGLAPDKGLYMPDIIPGFKPGEIKDFSSKDYYEIAFDVINKFLRGEIGESRLMELVRDAYNFHVPLENVYGNFHIMRLDQGPTASFKDFAARMMARLMQYFLQKENKSLLILTATSGDTGSAIANAFYKLDNIRVVVLFPGDEVSARQRKQMTTLGENINIVSVDGKFDDCQALVKEAFIDSDLESLNLSSANSINIGRLIPQVVYYFYSFALLRDGKDDDNIIFSVPSGNFGDMMGGILAKRMGLPVKKFVISVNENDEFPRFLETGLYSAVDPSRNCLSSAMNVGHPSNLSRLVALYGGQMDERGNIIEKPDMNKMRDDIFSVSVTDSETKEMIGEAHDRHQLLLEPHGAVGWKGLMNYVIKYDIPDSQLSVSLETAHPAKFPEEIRDILGIDPALPLCLEGLDDKEEHFDRLGNDYRGFKDYLQTKFKKVP